MGILLAEMCGKRPPIDAGNIIMLGKKICMGDYTPIPQRYSTEMK
jgi:serine/threonine protein kinase